MAAGNTGNQSGREPDTGLALEEYRILQGKIDKFGEFHFHVRGWTVTLITALLLTTLQSGVSPYALLVGLPLVGIFRLLEAQQTVWQRAFTARLFELERDLRVRSRGVGAPRIARVVGMTASELRRSGPFGWLVLRVRTVFYCAMYLLVATAFLLVKLGAPHRDEFHKIEIVDSRVGAGTSVGVASAREAPPQTPARLRSPEESDTVARPDQTR